MKSLSLIKSVYLYNEDSFINKKFLPTYMMKSLSILKSVYLYDEDSFINKKFLPI